MKIDIWDLEISAHAKLIYFVFEKYKNKNNGLCYPSLDTIAANASLCRNTVIKSIKELEDQGIIEIKKIRPKGARFTVNSYRTVFDSARFDKSNDRSNDRSRDALKPIKLIKPITDNNISNTEQYLTNTMSKDENFEIFWRSYPKQRAGSRDKAYLAWKKAINKINHERLIQVCVAYANSEEVLRGYAKGCAAWLNDERWTTDYTTKKGNQNATNSQTRKNRIDAALERSWLDTECESGREETPALEFVETKLLGV